MRKLFLILVAFIAVVTFIRALDNDGTLSGEIVPVVSETGSELFIN